MTYAIDCPDGFAEAERDMVIALFSDELSLSCSTGSSSSGEIKIMRCHLCNEPITPDISMENCQPVSRALVPLRPRPPDQPLAPNPYFRRIWLHQNCESRMYATYLANGWQPDDLDEFFRIGDYSVDHLVEQTWWEGERPAIPRGFD